jgi:RNA polymerase sigma factor (sigma-70 family)
MVQWEAELTELVVRRGGALVGYAYSLTRDKPQAEDLVQDALVKVYSRLRRPAPAGNRSSRVNLDSQEATNAEGYVRRAILTIYLDGYRRRSHWTGLKHLLADDAHSPGADRVATARVDVGVALRRLTPRQREAVTLRFFEDMTVPQIAAALGTSQGTIKRHLSDGLAQLRALLAEMEAPEMETSLEDRLGAVSGSVRRRRTAKVGAIGGASLVLVGLLGVAALWGPGRILSDPVPPATPSPTVSSQPVGAGWTPTGWESLGEQYHCGMEVTELVSSSDSVRVELTGDLRSSDGLEFADGGALVDGLAAPIRITRTDAVGPALHGGYPALVFAQNGQVVDIGPGWFEGGYTLPDAGASVDDLAEARATTACGQWTMPDVREEYLDQRPAGTYDVYAVVQWGDGLAVSEPVTMEVPALDVPEEEPLTVGIRDGYQPPWLEGTNLVCGAYASGIPGSWQAPWARSVLELRAEDRRDGAPQDEATATFTETEGEPVDTTRTPFTTVWLSDGRVVGVGRDVWSDPVEPLRVDARGETSVVVRIEPDVTCLENPDAGLPAGVYDVYAVTELDPGSGGERQFLSADVGSEYVVED